MVWRNTKGPGARDRGEEFNREVEELLHLREPGPRPPGDTAQAQLGGDQGGAYENDLSELIIIKPAFSGKGYEYV